jgi:hypothetical protein
MGAAGATAVNMENLVYEEWVAVGTLMKALIGLFSLLITCILLTTIVVGVAIQHPFLIIALSSVVAFVLFLFWNYKGIKIQVGNKKLVVNYGIFNRKSILLEDIVSCETIKASFKRYGGIGVRYGIDGSWAYTTSFGNAVKIIPRKGRPFAFSSNNPQQICGIISQTKNVP